MPRAMPLPDQETLMRLLDYNAETGALTWKVRTPDMFQERFHPVKRRDCRLAILWLPRSLIRTDAGLSQETAALTGGGL